MHMLVCYQERDLEKYIENLRDFQSLPYMIQPPQSIIYNSEYINVTLYIVVIESTQKNPIMSLSNKIQTYTK